ncbi:type I-E CRISPR-associated protein Cas6/Cse3/CasE [Thermoproteota archaeon]
MFISQIKLKMSDNTFFELSKMLRTKGYLVHQYLWNIFSKGPDDNRDFLYRQISSGKKLSFIAVSKEEPNRESGIWDIETKSYCPLLKKDQILSFSVRANAIVSKKDEKGKQKRCDVVMDAKYHLRKIQNELKLALTQDIINESGIKWLKAREEKNGFLLDEKKCFVYSYDQHRFFKQGSAPISFSTIDIKGVLSVTDLEKFTKLLFNGIGPCKGFGCGLMLIR